MKKYKAFPNLEASAGGQISIDIHEKGKNKSQIIDKLNGLIYFVGDKTMEGGNDFPIAKALSSPNKVFQVSDWSETLKLLSTELKNKSCQIGLQIILLLKGRKRI